LIPQYDHKKRYRTDFGADSKIIYKWTRNKAGIETKQEKK